MKNLPLYFAAFSSIHAKHLCGELALDEVESLRAVLVDVLLVGIGIISGAAIWVGRVAVRLDDGGGSWRALEALWAGRELSLVLAHCHIEG